MEVNVRKEKKKGGNKNSTHAHLKRAKAKCFSGSVPAEPGVQLPSPEGRLGRSTLPVGGSTLPTLHCNLADLLAETSPLLQPPEGQLDLRLNKHKALKREQQSPLCHGLI